MKINNIFGIVSSILSATQNVLGDSINNTSITSPSNNDIAVNNTNLLLANSSQTYNPMMVSSLDNSTTTFIKSAIQEHKKYHQGINISKWQGKINAKLVQDDDIKLAIIRATEGATYQDPKFEEYWGIFSNTTVKQAAYHNFRALSSTPEEQLQNINTQLQAVGFNRHNDALAISLPSQGNEKATPDQMSDGLNTLLILLKSAGYKHLYINTNNNEWTTHVNSDKYDFGEYNLWISHYTHAESPIIPSSWKNWDWWQYSCSEHIKGIPSNAVCMNYIDHNDVTVATIGDADNVGGDNV
ncbi:glycoside hydrolase family 25 protein [Rickettsia endosymbiont of Urophora cardui]|uniref:glycoside hydrolase family 25 protein n=1 Tax=Rickettsia endosymbiont of Urophora cardui TaxID=3066265 RepID=UPI00313E18DF